MLEETSQETGNVLNSCIVMLNPEVARKHHVITVTKKIKHPYVYFDTTLMTEIVLNILGNAVKYTSNEGTIQCSLMQYPHENKDWIYQKITISDNGIGMSKEFLEHIFENFERERSTTLSGVNGTGLGMAIVKKLVDLMNGTIKINSEIGNGTTVIIETVSVKTI